MLEFSLSNHAGEAVDLTDWFQPQLASGQLLTAGAADAHIDVVPGERYVATNYTPALVPFAAFLGFADLAVAANKLIVLPAGERVGINIPLNITELHYMRTAATDAALHIVKTL